MKHYSSYWEQTVLLKTFDFIVLGAGLIGKQISLKIKEKYPSARVGLLDRSAFSYGASTRNAGFACFGSVSEIIDDFKRSSQKEVLLLAQKRQLGIQKLVETFGAREIGFRPTGSFEIFEKNDTLFYEETLSQITEVNNLLKNQTGLEDIFSVKSTQNFGMDIMPNCIFNPHEGMLNSGLLNEVIAEAVHKSGVIPLYGIHVEKIQQTNNGYQLVSETGIELSCHQLILATNAFAAELLTTIDVVPARGQIIITKPIEAIPFDGIFHADKGYIYFRNIDNRILLGGGRNHFLAEEHTFEMEGSNEVVNYLTEYLSNIILPGQSFEIEMNWSGIMGMGKEKIPIVEKLNDNLIACVRMSGMGVALGPMVSQEVLDLIA